MSDNGGCIFWSLLPLRRYADFRGRSRRTELVAFYLVFIAVGAPLLALAMLQLHSSEVATAVGGLLGLALLCPSVALAVRRLHDSGRSGWWLLLAVPGAALSVWQDFRPGAALGPEGLSLVDLTNSVASLVLLVLLLWSDDPEPNLYGPNPRFDPPEGEAQDLA